MSLLSRALLMWFALLVVMFGNGTFRALVLQPRFGEGLGRQLSAVSGICLVFALSGLFVRHIGVPPRGELLRVGSFWLALTVAFELLFGHYVSGASWRDLLADYDVVRGRLWPLVLLAALLSPLLWGFLLRSVKQAPR